MTSGPEKRRVRLVDIAVAAGVDKSTVSLALRGDPRIKEETRQRILSIAKEMDYRPDPHLSQLMGYLRSKEDKNQGECVAYLKLEPPGERDLEETPIFREFQRGARSEMERLGYRVEVFRLADYASNASRLSDVLLNRGIRGLLVSPPVGISKIEGFNWSEFAAITMGYRLREPSLCRVVCDQFITIRLVLETLVARDYTRPLLAYRKGRDLHVNRRWSIAFEGSSNLFPTLAKTHVFSGDAGTRFVDFVRRNEIDAVIGLSYDFAEALQQEGMRFPEDIGFALLDKYDGAPGTSSIDQQPFLLGQMSARQLSGFLDRNEIGVPVHPFTTTIRPVWCEGTTLNAPQVAHPRVSTSHL